MAACFDPEVWGMEATRAPRDFKSSFKEDIGPYDAHIGHTGRKLWVLRSYKPLKPKGKDRLRGFWGSLKGLWGDIRQA